ncbi:hypothetical protein WA026_008659 [Henosepilachna vigintioctopunctata]|uniref:Glycoprotein hormone subunit beta domain-containing protein n=1 Tax=Henosepilachna vigintioctopunctata TaxID=420089 RepID=A0AAW1UB03_9CUCU
MFVIKLKLETFSIKIIERSIIISGHPNVKLFITQGGLQSMEEAIDSAVPMLGIPFYGDQFNNVNKMVDKEFGLKLDVETMESHILKDSILEVLNNPKYKKNIDRLSIISKDQPMRPLDKAVWWAEYVLRHKTTEHLRSPTLWFSGGGISRFEYRKMKQFISLQIYIIVISTTVRSQSIIDVESLIPQEPETLSCEEMPYTFSVVQTDANGKQCWGAVTTNACKGRCDSNEISDWRFPFKKSNHPVCVHYGRNRNVVTLRHCEEGALPEAARYEYLEAVGCKCQICSSSDTSCEGITYRPHRSYPVSWGY